MNTLIGIMEKEIKENKETILGRFHAMLLESKPLVDMAVFCYAGGDT